MAGERGRTSPGWNDHVRAAARARASARGSGGRSGRRGSLSCAAFVVEWATADAADRACRASPSALDDPS